MTEVPALGRDRGSGKFLPGNKLGGRRALPDHFTEYGDDFLRVLRAAATGQVRDDDPPAAVEVAANCEPKDRIKAAEICCNRIYGKAPETITMENASAVLDAIVGAAKPVGPKED